MAALHKIRSNGKILIAVLGLALFAFIAEEFVRSLSYSQNESRQQVGEVHGNSITIQDFNALVQEYTEVLKLSSGITSPTDEQVNMIQDQVWQTYVNEKVLAHEAEKLGLTVTNAELQKVVNEGKNPLLLQTPFRTAQGTFDVNALKQFLHQYEEIMQDMAYSAEQKEQVVALYNYWKFLEKTLKSQLLMEKYQTLLSSALLSNPVAAKKQHEAKVQESELFVAAIPYTTIKDEEVEISDAELQAKYNEMKEIFATLQDTRSIKYIDVQVKASQADKDALREEMNGHAEALKAGENPAKVVRDAASKIAYSVLPTTSKIYPTDIANRIDTMKVGEQVGPFNVFHDNSMNIVRLINKVQLPDSVEYRQIQAPSADLAAAEKTADSILTALRAGEPFDSLAKKYNQVGTKTWLTSSMYEGQLMDENNRKYVETLINAEKDAFQKVVLAGQGVIVAQVTDRKKMVDKYQVAVIKRSIDFSKETYNKAYGDISSFLAGNRTLQEIEEGAAEAGYNVQVRPAMSNTEHGVLGIRRTSEALRWVFNEDTKVGDVSPLYECGDNDHLLVLMLTGIEKKGYMPWTDERVKEILTAEVLKDKKAVMLAEKMKDAKSVADVIALGGAISDTIKHVTGASNTFVTKLASSEPTLSGVAMKSQKGNFVQGIKGNAAVYALQVLDKKTLETPYNEEQIMMQQEQTNMRAMMSFNAELYKKANVVDKRYLFY